jgi:hypothetical protein
MLLIFVLGWPFEWPAVVLVFLPIFLPVVDKLQLGMSKLDMLNLVRNAGGRQFADRFLKSTRRYVGVLPQERRAAMEPVDDLQGHGGLHGDPDHLPACSDLVAGNRVVVAQGT